MLNTKEHIELMEFFERTNRTLGRFDKEPKEAWHRQIIYQDGRVNEMFLMFRNGYAYGAASTRE